MKEYILSIVAAAVICAITKVFLNNKTAIGRIAGLISGILMTVTVVAPLGNITFSGITAYLDGLSSDAREYVAEGMSIAESETVNIIKSQTGAYILDKANRMGLEISVEVELDGHNGNIPCGVTVTGNVSPYAREQLGSYMEDTLGIAKENQKWK